MDFGHSAGLADHAGPGNSCDNIGRPANRGVISKDPGETLDAVHAVLKRRVLDSTSGRACTPAVPANGIAMRAARNERHIVSSRGHPPAEIASPLRPLCTWLGGLREKK